MILRLKEGYTHLPVSILSPLFSVKWSVGVNEKKKVGNSHAAPRTPNSLLKFSALPSPILVKLFEILDALLWSTEC